MSPRLSLLQPYPFAKLRQLMAGVTPNPALKPINLSIGEPKHPTPQLVKDALLANLAGLESYPAALGSDALRQSISVVPQRVHLFSATLRDNLLLAAPHASDDALSAVLRRVGLEKLLEGDGLNAWLGEGGRQLSGGELRRLAIARALLRKPKVLILDDSTSAVDTATDAKIRKAFREEIPGTTKIIIAQRISSVQDADRILVLDNGQINGLGTHEELLKNNAIYQEVYNSQTQGGGDFDKQGGEQ